MTVDIDTPPTIVWVDNHVEIIDQTLLPTELRVIELRTVEDVVDAIGRLAVRGAPAIGACGAYGIVVAIDQLIAAGGSAGGDELGFGVQHGNDRINSRKKYKQGDWQAVVASLDPGVRLALMRASDTGLCNDKTCEHCSAKLCSCLGHSKFCSQCGASV